MDDLTLEPTTEESTRYQIALPEFYGPLDLLLSLIEKEELDITKIALARVTDQYLARIEELTETDPHELTDFLVIAAKLILIKSEVLLPKPPPILAAEEEEDVGDELARQLILYKKFKEVAGYLRQWEEQGQRSHVRIAPRLKVEPKLVPGEGDLKALLTAARRAFTIKPEDPPLGEVISPPLVTIGQQVGQIWQAIHREPRVSFNQLLGQSKNKIEVIVTLLAILELIKRRVVIVEQLTRFGDILIEKKADVPALTAEELEEWVGMTEVS
jgi:segregation and condensation protein A